MQQDPIAKKKYQEFLKTVVKKGKVYSLGNDEGIASAESFLFRTEQDEAAGMIFFWSEKRLAEVHSKAEWGDYEPQEIPLATFLENVCIGLETDGYITAVNFDANLIGYEVRPLELVLECLIKLRKEEKTLTFARYEDAMSFEKIVRQHLTA